ncbi:MAG: GGDEF domain-containing protein [Acidobacteriota bacterium]
MFRERRGPNIIFRDWSNHKKEDDPEEVAEGIDEATRAVAAFLKIYGRHAFSTDQVDSKAVRQQCDAWVRHFLNGGPAPGRRDNVEFDWNGVQRFVGRHRRREQIYVHNSMRDLRNMIWEFIQGISQTVSEGQQSDGQVTKRLSRLKEAVQRDSIEELKREVVEAVHTIGEAIELRQERQRSQMLQLGQKLRQMRCELVEARQKMSSDPFTRLYNRSAFDDHLKRTVDLCLFSGQPASLMMLDADHFKKINDEFGHQAGDTVLRQLADCCVRTFPRKSDFVARYGGEEFAVIVSDAGVAVCGKLAKSLVEAVQEMRVEHEGNQIHLTVSIGVAELVPGDSVESWLRRADQALYQAKSEGRNKTVLSALRPAAKSAGDHEQASG